MHITGNIKSLLQEKNRAEIFAVLLQLSIVLFVFGFEKISNVLIMLMLLHWLLDKRLVEKLKTAFANKIVLFFISYFILTIIGLLYSDFHEGIKVVERRLLFVLIPVIMSTTSIDRQKTHLLLTTFAMSCALAILVGLINASLLFWQTGDTGYFFNDNLTLPIGIQAAYFAIYVNISIVISVYILNTKIKTQWLYMLLITILIIGEFLLATRISILTLLLLISGYIVYLIIKRGLKTALIAGVIFLLGISAIYISFPQTVNRFRSMFSNLEYQYDNPNPVNHFNAEVKKENWNGLTLRLALWNCGWEVIQENPFFGAGTGDYKEAMAQKIDEKNFIYAREMRFGVHNQYLYTWMTFGFLGLIIFLSSLVYPAINAYKQENYLYLTVVFIFALSFLTENVLNRYFGVYLFVVMSCVTFFGLKK